MQIEYLLDRNVDDSLDRQLRELLCRCFSKPPEVAVFSKQRFFNDSPKHRFIVRDEKLGVVAHLALHEKVVTIGDVECPIGGVAEVCVHPDYRGRGWVSQLMQQAHELLKAKGIAYSVLYGDVEVYGSIGYRKVHNLLVVSDRGDNIGEWAVVPAMVFPLGKTAWPEEKAYLPGKTF